MLISHPSRRVHAPLAIANPRLTDLPNAGFDAGLLAAAGTVLVGRGVDFQHPAGPPDRHAPIATTPSTSSNLLAQSFRRMASCSISPIERQIGDKLAKLRILVLQLLSRHISGSSRPAYFFFHLKESHG